MLCIGTFMLANSVTCISPLSSQRQVPAVPRKSLILRHAHFTPDTVCAAFGIHSQTYPEGWTPLRF
ncbi:hypothetical protein HMPREF1613_01321 [Escherichia coli 908616]|nr:hypothetical protein HMPREF1599_02507 [Escherichia coli 907713]ESD54285.1 hypothetical protein HMPREF1605_02502 [Escherichia coli 908521]ESD93269.1 hypothetical protein HMPREF1613_01321 [Escherichia coli 908616]